MVGIHFYKFRFLEITIHRLSLTLKYILDFSIFYNHVATSQSFVLHIIIAFFRINCGDGNNFLSKFFQKWFCNHVLSLALNSKAFTFLFICNKANEERDGNDKLNLSSILKSLQGGKYISCFSLWP